jgi:hypothetical protein
VEDSSGKVVIEGGTAATAARKGEWDGSSIAGPVVKASPHRRYTLQVAYPVNKADAVIAADGHRDFTGPEALEEAAWAYLTKSPKVGLHHAPGTDGSGTVVESYIWRGDDWTIKASDGSEQTVKAGDWLVGIVWSPDAWDLVLSKRINGVSMQGSASRRRPSPEALAALRS